MEIDFIVAVYQTGEFIVLNGSDKLPGSQVASLIKCKFDGTTSSKQNDYYTYSVFDNNFDPIDSNSFSCNEFICAIEKRDKWSQPINSWTGNHHYEIRLAVTISTQKGESATINLQHSFHKGEAFKTLSKVLSTAKAKGLSEAIGEFIQNSK